MNVDFEESTHTYSVNGIIATISFTELLHKHGIAPDYSGVNGSTLNESAEFGKTIHKDIERVINTANYEPQTEFGKTFLAYAKKNIESAVAELKMGINYKGLVIGGTADMIGFLKGSIPFIADNKITAGKNTEYWAWQISLENYALKKLGKELLNGKQINWKGAEKIFVFWFDKATGKLQKNKVVELGLIPDKEIERLLECEYNGEIYKRRELSIDKTFAVEVEMVEDKLKELEEEFAIWKNRAETYRKELLNAFKKQGIISWESPSKRFKITYVPQSEQIRVDNAKLREDYPQIYEKVTKLTKKNEYLLIKERKENGSEN